jgi:uncharacterized surface protein with fasciclin (FAS1) repeats
VKPLTDLLSTAEEVGAKRFADYLRRSDLGAELLAGTEPFTLFAPTDDAFDEVSPETRRGCMRTKKGVGPNGIFQCFAFLDHTL